MKYSLFISIMLVTAINRLEAKTNRPPDALVALSKKLTALQTISFQFYREINNPDNNYFNTFTGSCYIEFNQTDKQTVSRYRMECDSYISVYNGSEDFFLDKKLKTYSQRAQPKQRSFSTQTFFLNSIQTLRSVIQQWVQSDSMLMFERDTLIQNKSYKLVQVNKRQYPLEYLNNFDKMDPLPDSVTLFYSIIIDPETGLPYQVLQTSNRYSSSFKTVFTNVNTRPAEPEADSWFCSTYQKEYQPRKKENRQLIASGAVMMPVWSMREYNGKDTPVFSSSAVTGKLVLYDFWIKGCGPCMASFPIQQRLQKTYGGDHFQLLSVNTVDKKEDISFFYKREQPLYKMLYEGEAMAKELGIDSYPTLILADKTGKVIYAGHNYEKVEELIKTNL
ncbi:hypothetical protein A4H97_27535 [Niastella yeongjuensis]|uniref:Thioredoxin domain-containing protein n=1 Tax=Niastella yeongjuensis TaxID=354355 RepID=A0A1V9EYU1_9BACT|nr:TlpA disulfide reductase family protein [Niastella yeongjuensis]OQP51333.1 hypothetical protein A4H97_27535 [Niastella yeongjuensis]SEP38758.1 Thiol-disulfide isomerase or thioredoxin [Niastella yeongjuensis]